MNPNDAIVENDPNEESDMESEDTSLASNVDVKALADDDEEDLESEDDESVVVDEEEEEEDDDDEKDDDSVLDDQEETLIKTSKTQATSDMEEEDEDEDEDEDNDEDYLQKFDENIRKTIIEDYHPELKQHNDDEVEALSKVVRSSDGTIIDSLHKTLPFLTKYEKARILGERAKQINAGAKPFIKIEDALIDGYLIALRELEEKKIPFIIRRPLPHGGSEYWKLADLEILIG